MVPAEGLTTAAAIGLDLSRRFGTVEVDVSAPGVVPVEWLEAELVHRAVVTYAAAEAAGAGPLVPPDRGRLRQGARAVRAEDRRLPGDQAPVRGDAGDRRGGHGRGLGRRLDRLRAWRTAGDDQWAFAADVAAVTCFDGAVDNAKACIQVLGGIGFTHEHDAHLYLRRALSLRSLVESSDAAAERLTDRAVAGVRRKVHVDLEGRDADDPRRRARRGRATRCAAGRGAPAGDGRGRRTSRRTGRRRTAWEPMPSPRSSSTTSSPGPASTRPDIVIAGWAVPTILEARDRGAEGAVREAVPAGRPGLVPAVLRAGRRLGPRLAAHEGRAGRRRVEAVRPEGVELGRRARRLGHLPGPHRRRGAEAQGHQLLPRRHEEPGHRRASAARDHRRGAVQRGVPRRRVRPGRLPGRRGRRRLEAGPHHARQRAGRDGHQPTRRRAPSVR